MLEKPEHWAVPGWTAAHRMPVEARAAVELLGPKITCHFTRVDALDANGEDLRP